jgi:spermidine synthase
MTTPTEVLSATAAPGDAARAGTGILALFGATLFLSAFLLFLLEPMIAKMVLPVLGGTPMVWNTCVLFFQVILLSGYAYAHGASSLFSAKRHALVYAVILAVPVVVLPFALQGASEPPTEANPIPWLLGVLLRSVGLPFFALSTSASLLQKLFSKTGHSAARDPYFLYAASNTGSLLALLAYPSLVEPSLALGAQTRVWAIGYVVFGVMALGCLVVALRASAVATRDSRPVTDDSQLATDDWQPATVDSRLATFDLRLQWTLLALIPSSLMLAVTSYLATDIAAVPLMWVLPLGLYLLTFVAAFGSGSEWWRRMADRRLPMLMVALVAFMIVHVTGPGWLVVPVHIAAFTLGALLCHCELAARRPAPAQLTEFYFWMSFGGMLGGVFNTLIAPVAFSGILEYPLALLAVCFVRTGLRRAATTVADRIFDWATPLVVAALTVVMIGLVHRAGASPRLALFIPGLIVFSQMKHAFRFGASLTAMLVAGMLTPNANADGTVLHRERTFFGVYRVSIDASHRYRTLFHGTTLHGVEALDPARAGESLTYYHRTGPFGQAFERLSHASHAKEVAVVGLGVGTLAAYARPDQRWTFYEIDPAVERIARAPNGFTFLRDCGDRCNVVLGDARLSLARESDRAFGLFVLDAFSSDSIPVHLITSEAIDLYLKRLAPDGVIAVHISNRHLRLAPVLGRLALAHGLVALEQRDWVGADMRDDGKGSSDWVVMARSRSDLGALVDDRRWLPPPVPADTPLWTDAFSNILGVFAFAN